MATDKIPCLDLSRQHQKIKGEIFEIFEEVYDKTAFSGGAYVEKFEIDFANFIGGKHCIGVSNGTVALHLSMLALNIGLGDEVIVPANTFIASAWGVSHSGARPVFVDCDDTWNIDVNKIEAAITPKTKAIIGVHLYGQPFDVEKVKAICDKYNLYLIEDAAQAHGATYKGRRVGTFGELSCFSFYPGKNLGACGEAGGIVTDNDKLDEKLRSLRNHGSKVRYYHDEVGYNFRMGGLEGASLKVKLKYLAGWNERRQQIAGRYRKEINNSLISFQKKLEGSESANHLFVVTVPQKEQFIQHLEMHGIVPAYHYPVPCHLQKAYQSLGYKQGDFPTSEYLAAHCVSLPMFAELTDDEVGRVIDAVNGFK